MAAARQKPFADDEIDATLPFDDFLDAAGQAFGGSILILFDQFEEYFLYYPVSETGNTFDGQFARAINRDEVDAGFLIALREDALSKLDRFRVRIPNLLGNTLRLQHMDAVAAEQAIRKPLEVYNRRLPTSATPIAIEDRLVWAIRDQVRIGQVQLVQADGAGQAQTHDDTVRIEAPFLQLVMTRLWDEEMQANSRTLRLSPLERLGGAQEIVRTHLDGVMITLDAAAQEVVIHQISSATLISRERQHYLCSPAGIFAEHSSRGCAPGGAEQKRLLNFLYVGPIAPSTHTPPWYSVLRWPKLDEEFTDQ